MAGFSIDEIIEMQRKLQSEYKGGLKNESISPENSRFKLLWLVSQVGEVIDLVKKHEPHSIVDDQSIRRLFLEEMSDVLMYYADILLCFDVTPNELKRAFEEKNKYNLLRWQ